MNLFKRKEKEKEVVKERLPIGRVNLVRYSYDVWQKFLPKSNQLEWENKNFPNNTALFLTQSMLDVQKEHIVTGNTQFCIVPIDDEYIKWLNGRDHSTEKCSEYIRTLTDEDVKRLNKKNGFDKEYLSYGMLLYTFKQPGDNGKESFKLPEDVRKELELYLNLIYGKVYLPGYIIKQEDFVTDKRTFESMTKSYFEKDASIKYGKWEEQNFEKDVTLYQMAIPFGVQKINTEATVTYLDSVVNLKGAPNVTFDRKTLDYYGRNVVDFVNSDINGKLINYFGDTSVVIGGAILAEAVPEISKQILESFASDLKKLNINFDFK